MDYLPISIKISTFSILIVGGGKVASHKAAILSRFTKKVTIIAPRISDEIKDMPFKWIEKNIEEKDLEGVQILFVCTNNHELNNQIKQWAYHKGILTSVCDNPSLCDFVSPAIYCKDNITISVGSDARDVKRSIRIRNRITELIENDTLQID